MDPFDSLPVVFLLFLLKDEFHEQLLQFLVAIIDAKLLEGIFIEDFEAVNIQNTDHGVFA